MRRNVQEEGQQFDPRIISHRSAQPLLPLLSFCSCICNCFFLHNHYSLSCTISDTIADILSPWLLLGVGWQFTLSISGATVVVPGVGTYPLRFVPSPHTCYAVDIVPAVTLGCPEASYTLFDPANSSHTGLPVTELLFDSGATASVLRRPCLPLLQRLGSITVVSILGVAEGGDLIPPIAAGFLDIAFPGFPHRPLGFAVPGGLYHVIPGSPLPDGPPMDAALALRPTGRPSASPGIRTAADLALRFNIFDHSALREAHEYLHGV